MSVLHLELLRVPIYRYSQDDYYGKEKDWFEKRKKKIEKGYNQDFDSLPKEKQSEWFRYWEWPRWWLNNIIGYLIVGYDGGSCITAEMWLKTKYLPLNLRNKVKHFGHTKLLDNEVTENHDIRRYLELDKVRVDILDNTSMVKGVNELLDVGCGKINELGKGFYVHSDLLPPKYLDLVGIIGNYKNSKQQ